MTYREDLWAIAVENHGIVTTRQAEDAGVPAVEVRKLAARGALQHLARGVYRHKQAAVDDLTDLAAAVAAAGDTAFLEKEAVLALFGLAAVNPITICVGDLRRNRTHVPRHVTVERREDIDPADITEYSGIRATTVHRALLDCLPRLMNERVAEAADKAARQGLIDEVELAEVNVAMGRRERQLADAAV